MEGLEMQCFQIISAVGMAKSSYIEAVQEAKKGNIEKAKELIKEGEKAFVGGHEAHAGLIQQEASGEAVQLNMLLMHAEDQLMAAETCKIMAVEMIELYERLLTLEGK